MNQTVFSDTPHERGPLGKPTVLLDNLGIIPACAGSTPSSPRPPRAGWNHPRVRGEHRARQRSTLPGSGSSPHTRGARDNAPARRPLLGIIPACAGSTSWRIGVQGFLRNHPRMRGEHAIPGSRPSRASGSSPHARGTLLAPRLPVGAQGIIPACAGSTCTPRPRLAPWWDHPRMRGERKDSSSPSTPSAGSSPHTRGTLHLDVPLHLVGEISPACAGSTLPWPGLRPPGGDHPRMRGEHSSRGRDPVPRPGSSPHVRRARRTRPPCGCWRRIIPACAGSTVCLSATPRCGILNPPEKTWATGPE